MRDTAIGLAIGFLGGLLGMGFTGLMTNGAADYASLFNPAGVTAGGAAGDPFADLMKRIGAERAGNKDGTIPAWDGGLKQFPAGFKMGDAFRPDPFASEKPRLVVTGKARSSIRRATLSSVSPEA